MPLLCCTALDESSLALVFFLKDAPVINRVLNLANRLMLMIVNHPTM